MTNERQNLRDTRRKLDDFKEGLRTLSSGLNNPVHPHFFVSHSAADEKLARQIKGMLMKGIRGTTAYVSSDGGNPAGSYWPQEIRDNLVRCTGVVLLFTPSSIDRPWLHFEAGAGLILGKPCFILTVGDVSMDDLKGKGNPFHDLQWSQVADRDDVLNFMRSIAHHEHVDRSFNSSNPEFRKAVSGFMNTAKTYLNNQRMWVEKEPILLDRSSRSHSLEKETVKLLGELANSTRQILGNEEPLKLLSVSFRLKHEVDLIDTLNSRPGKLELPIRKQHVYKRYVFLRLLEMLRPGYSYSTFSTLDFWIKDEGKPTIKHFIEENRRLSSDENGLRIQRIVLVDPEVFGVDPSKRPAADAAVAEVDEYHKAVGLKNVWKLLDDYGLNENTIMYRDRSRISRIDKQATKLSGKRFMNIFLIKSDEVMRIVRRLGENRLPNAYVQGDGKQMVVKVLRAESETPAKIEFTYSKDNKAFGNHRKVFKELLRIAVRENGDMMGRMDAWL